MFFGQNGEYARISYKKCNLFFRVVKCKGPIVWISSKCINRIMGVATFNGQELKPTQFKIEFVVTGGGVLFYWNWGILLRYYV